MALALRLASKRLRSVRCVPCYHHAFHSQKYSNKPCSSSSTPSSSLPTHPPCITLLPSLPTMSLAGALQRRHFAKKKKAGNQTPKNKKAEPDDGEDVDEIDLEAYEQEMEEIVKNMSEDLRRFRAGRATPEMIEDIKVKVYGVPTPLKAVAQISIRDAYNIIVAAHDPSTLSDIDAGIRNSERINVGAKIEGNKVVVTFPKSTKESRHELVKAVKQEGEKAKTKIRRIRQHALDEIKGAQKTLPKDDMFNLKKEAQNVTDKAIKNIEDSIAQKSEEILSL